MQEQNFNYQLSCFLQALNTKHICDSPEHPCDRPCGLWDRWTVCTHHTHKKSALAFKICRQQISQEERPNTKWQDKDWGWSLLVVVGEELKQ
jgi:hypothetical protein